MYQSKYDIPPLWEHVSSVGRVPTTDQSLPFSWSGRHPVDPGSEMTGIRRVERRRIERVDILVTKLDPMIE